MKHPCCDCAGSKEKGNGTRKCLIGYPAAIPIRHTTKCQYSVAAPMSAVAMEKTMMAVPTMAVRGSTSAMTPLMMRKHAKTLAKAEPARIWYSMPRPE